MPFSLSSQINDTACVSHQFTTNWKASVPRVTADTCVITPNKRIQFDILNLHPRVHVLSFVDLIAQPLSTRKQKGRCLWVLKNYPEFISSQTSFLCADRHPKANTRGSWANDVWIDEKRRFGIEIELTSSDFVSSEKWKYKKWLSRAESLRVLLQDTLGSEHVATSVSYKPQKKYSCWQVVYDESAGWEVVSPILQGRKGMKEVYDAVTALQQASSIGVRIAKNTGMHVHISWDESLSKTKRLLHWWLFFEPSLATLVHPQRISFLHSGYFSKTYSNGHCTPLSQSVEGSSLHEAQSLHELCTALPRSSGLNIHSIAQKGTVEFRMLESTLDPQLAIFWISLCQQIGHIAAEKKFAVPLPKDWECAALLPSGDANALIHAFMPGGSKQTFLNQVIHRRRQMAARWCKNQSLFCWLSFMKRWAPQLSL